MEAVLNPSVPTGIGVAMLIRATLQWAIFPRSAGPAIVFCVLHLTAGIGLMVYFDKTTPLAPAVLTAVMRLAFEAVVYRPAAPAALLEPPAAKPGLSSEGPGPPSCTHACVKGAR